MPRLYREAPLMGIWEGSGNVSALDTLRAMATRPECVEVLFDELAKTAGQDAAARRPRRRAAAAARRPRDHPVPRPQGRRGHLPGAAGLAAGAPRPPRRRRGVPGHPARRPVGRRVRHHAGRAGPRADPRAGAGQGMTREGARQRTIRPVDFDNLKTMTYEVTDRVARITFNRPEKGNAIVADTPLELSALVERADLDPDVHVILVSGRGEGSAPVSTCRAYADGTVVGRRWQRRTRAPCSTGKTQAINHLPDQPWDPMIDYQMMSRFVRGFASLMHADKPTVVKIHGYCVAGGTDIALHADQVIAAADAKIGYPPMRVWGVPAAGLWAHRLGDQRAKRLLFTGDCITGAQAAEWGLAVEAPDPADLDERTERLVERIAAMPVNQLIMAKLALNTALLQPGRGHQPDGQHRVRRRRPAHPGGPRLRRRRRRARLPRRGARTATSRSATTAARRPGSSDVDGQNRTEPDDRPFGGAERAARCPPGVGQRGRIGQAHSGFRHQGADAAGGADPDGRRGRPGPLGRRLPAVRSAAGPPAPPGRRAGPAAAALGRHLDHVGHHQCRHRRPHPGRAANHAAGQAIR